MPNTSTKSDQRPIRIPYSYQFNKFQPLVLRLWHWGNAAVILALLGTVLIRKTFLSWRTNSAIIAEKMNAAGTPITPEFAKEIAVTIRNPLWDWHICLGFMLGALVVTRILIAIFVEKKCHGISVLNLAKGIKNVSREQRQGAIHFIAVKLGYMVFYLATATMVSTGLLLAFKSEIGLSKEFSQTIKEFHELLMWFFVLFVGGHLIGVVIAENRKDPGIVSSMIHGGTRDKRL